MSESNNFYIERTCTEAVYKANGSLNTLDRNKSLKDFREKEAYVLLGEPGAGKTYSFEHEKKQPDCEYITARDFIGLGVQEEWKSKTLFIDGLDEVRIGTSNGLIPLDAIRKRLIELGRPNFRISCREADWIEASDRRALEAITSGGSITVLHLDELSQNDIEEFVRHEDSELELSKFIEWSHNHGLMPMMANPQILKLVIKAVSGDEWPDNRKEIYRIACEMMVREDNDPHQQSEKNKKYATKKILDTAGKLFAHQLISGIEGYSMTQTDEVTNNPYYRNIFEDESEELEFALKTKLFKHGASSEWRESVHRSIAEYLAAKYLSKIVDDGLSIRRVLSLIITVDGAVATSLRGLFAWFVTINNSQRELLLKHDALAVVLYGDVTTFSTEQKKDIFQNLYLEAQKHPSFRNEYWIGSPFGALATKDMEDVIIRYLESPLREEENQAFVYCVMDAIEHGTAFSSLDSSLLKIVEDHTWWPSIRQAALRVLIKISLNKDAALALQVLKDISSKRIEDKDDALLAILLMDLYPEKIKPYQVLNYYHHVKNEQLSWSYIDFWGDKLLVNTSDENVPILLDELVKKADLKELARQDYKLSSFISELLTKGVVGFGEKISVARLYEWLGNGLDKHGFSIIEQIVDEKKNITIQKWISDRPELYKQLLVEGTERCIKGVETWKYFRHLEARLCYPKAPNDIGFWYLEQAEKIKVKIISEDYFRQAVFQTYAGDNDKLFSLDTIFSWVGDHPKYEETLKLMLVTEGKEYDQILEAARNKIKRHSGQLKKKTDYLDFVLENKNDIKSGLAQPTLFYDIGNAYYGRITGVKGEAPYERLFSLLGDSSELVDIALSGLQKTIFRDDLPTADEIIKASISGKHYYIGSAILAGLEERSFSSNPKWNDISDLQYEKAIAFYLAHNADKEMQWFNLLLCSRSNLVVKVLSQFVIACSKAGKDNVPGVYQLAYDEAWSHIAKAAVLKLLEKHPARSNNSQIYIIERLLKAAIRYADKENLISLIDKKLSLSSMNMIQRSKWLATGLIVEPDKYQKDAESFMEAGAARVSALANFLAPRASRWQPDFMLPVKFLSVLIQKLGSHFKPYSFQGARIVSPDMDASDKVMSFISQLSKNGSGSALLEFKKLIKLDELSGWHSFLKRELYECEKRFRDASFVQPTIENVVKTLSNNEPSNAADLMALTIDHLEVLATNIRHSNTNDYRQYWNTDKNGNPTIPKVEDICRDALLSDLKLQLEKLNITAEKEGYFVEDKRSDIKITYMGRSRLVIPIEIKRDFHSNVWKAIKTQLVAQYTRDPDTQGYGIYLVFWFGTAKTPRPPTGKKPSTANEMKQALLATMTDEEKRLIGVCVIDCSVSTE